MPLLKIDHAHLAFGHWPLLNNVQFQIDAGERVALIGRNGTGKSSLLKVLAGELAPDDGTLWLASGLRVGYVSQEPTFELLHTVFSAVVSGMGKTSSLLTDYHELSQKLEASAHDDSLEDTDALLARLEILQHDMETHQVWASKSRAEQVIEVFGLDSDSIIGTLSGGQKKRLALARALAYSPDVLLLDEPTNHLDIAAIIWLETMLCQMNANIAIVFITHDRRFLENVATRIVELDRGQLQSFPGNFATYSKRKTLMLAAETQQNARSDKLLKAEEVWIRQGVQARSTRSVYRVQQLQVLRKARAKRRELIGNVKMTIAHGDRSGQLVAELQDVSKSFTNEDGQEKIILRNFSSRIMAGDKVGLIARNGAGKTTLLRLILGEIEPDSGSVHLGTKTTVAYFDQFREQLDLEARLQDVVASESEFVEINGKRKHVIGYLEDFLFPPERARSQVKMLSGGERNRLLLARLFARPANVLVLDEPTNDLDIETLELLEQLLSDYHGTVFLVSHDRSFLDNIVTQSIVFEGGNQGYWREYVGGYSDWQRQSTVSVKEAFSIQTHIKPTSAPTIKTSAPISDNKPAKLSWKENKELVDIPDKITQLEDEQKLLSKKMEAPNLYQDNPQEAQTMATRLALIEEQLLMLLERWESLESCKV